MIQKLTKIGRLVPDGMFQTNPFGLKLDYDTDDAVFIKFSKKNGKWVYKEIKVEEFSQSKADKYLVKTKRGNYTPPFPSFPVYNFNDLLYDVGGNNGNQKEENDQEEKREVNFEKSKIGKRVIRCLKKYKKQFEEVINELLQNKQLAKDLKFKVSDLSDFLLSFKFDNEYVGDSKWIAEKKESLKQAGNKDYYTYNNTKYEVYNKLCSVTNESQNTVWGYVSPYKFYAVKTELAAVPGGFEAKEAWKNFPVSPEGAKYLERGQKFIEKYLSFKFCGIKYFLIPERVLDRGDDDKFLNYIQDFKKFGLSGEEGANDQLEDDLIDLMIDQESNTVNYTLFFYKPQNAEFKILASIEDVFPSYAKKIFEEKKLTEDHSIFKRLKINGEIKDLEFSFSHIKKFIPETKPFLEIVRSIFMRKQVDYDYLLNKLTGKLEINFTNDRYLKLTLLKALLILKLLLKLELIEQTKTTDSLTMENKYEAFFAEHSEFFANDSATKKAVFLEGILVKKLLNVQLRKRDSTPFRSRLHSLKLKEKYIKRLLPETIEKLDQYKTHYKNLEETISKYLLKSRFEISDDEISFYFTMGMNLAGEFKSDNDKQKSN